MNACQSVYGVSEIQIIRNPPLAVGQSAVNRVTIRIHGTDGTTIDIDALTDHGGEPIRCNIINEGAAC